jgi:hypothetical protein
MKDRSHLEDTLAHEMVHAYDHLRFKLDWDDNLRHAACTEVCLNFPYLLFPGALYLDDLP